MLGKDLIMQTLLGGGGSGGGGSGGGVEPIKAFVSQPLTGEMQVKTIAPIISIDHVVAQYTNTNTTISGTFTMGAVGTTYIMVFSPRNPIGEPTLPDGWDKIAWCDPPTENMSNQWLYVAKRTVLAGEENITCEITFDVTSGQRNYLVVIDIGDSAVSVDDAIITKYSGVRTVTSKLHENSLVICSSETAVTGYTWKIESQGFAELLQPTYSNESSRRIVVAYVPYLSQQMSDKVSLVIPGNNTTGAILCALSLTPGTPSRYECVLDVEEITSAQALSILMGGETV